MATSNGASQPNPDFFYIDLVTIPDPIAEVLETHSGIPRDEQKDHVLRVRNEAHKAHPYPCLGRFRFLELDLSTHPLYQSYLLPTLKKSGPTDAQEPTFLDIGTCLGQDLRKLIVDGVPASRLYGCDILPAFIDAGYELFQDESKLPRSQFLSPADVFDRSTDNPLTALYDKVDIVHISAVFHLFREDQQADVAYTCMKLVRKTPGTRALILGSQVGNVNAQEKVHRNDRRQYRHNEESWRTLWGKITESAEFEGKIKGLDVKVDLQGRTAVQIESGQQQKHIGGPEEGFRWMVWQVWVQF